MLSNDTIFMWKKNVLWWYNMHKRIPERLSLFQDNVSLFTRDLMQYLHWCLWFWHSTMICKVIELNLNCIFIYIQIMGKIKILPIIWIYIYTSLNDRKFENFASKVLNSKYSGISKLNCSKTSNHFLIHPKQAVICNSEEKKGYQWINKIQMLYCIFPIHILLQVQGSCQGFLEYYMICARPIL